MAEISVIVAAVFDLKALHACLVSLDNQTQPAEDYEVIIVTAGAQDEIRKMLSKVDPSYRFSVCQKPGVNLPAALNRGVEAAGGHYCIFLQEGMAADPQLVAVHLQVQRERQGTVALGHTEITLPERAVGFAKFIAWKWEKRSQAFEKAGSAPSFSDCYRCNMSVPRDAFLKVGGFSEDYPGDEDIQLGYCLQCLGLSFTYLPKARARWDFPYRFREIAAATRESGSVSTALYLRHPATLPHLQLGSFNNTSLRGVLLLRLVLALNLPARLFEGLNSLLDQRSWSPEWYRWLHSYFYWQGVRRAVPNQDLWQRLVRGPVILMYHALGYPGESPSRYVISPQQFARQLGWLKRRRYNVISLAELNTYRRNHRLPPNRTVVITFDDGYEDNYTYAFPILFQEGFPATIFLVTSGAGGINNWVETGALAGRRLLAWQQVRSMHAAGLHFGGHTQNHASLPFLPVGSAMEEVAGSWKDLTAELGTSTYCFSYPNGQYNAKTQLLVEVAGFEAACGSHAGINDPSTDPYALKRVEIQGVFSMFRYILAVWIGQARGVERLWRGEEHPGAATEGGR